MEYYIAKRSITVPLTAATVLILLILNILETMGQKGSDTLQQAESLAYENRISEGFELCRTYCINHPQDAKALRLCGRLAYWSGNFRIAEQMFASAYSLAPLDAGLVAEYLEVLAQTGRLARARAIERELSDEMAFNADLGKSRALIAHYSGDPPKAAQHNLSFLGKYPDDKQALLLASALEQLRSPTLLVGADLVSDDQPLLHYRPMLGISERINPWLNPALKIAAPFRETEPDNYRSVQAGLSNEIMLADLQLHLTLGAGYFLWPADGQGEFTAEASIKKQFLRRWRFSAAWERKPYLSTLSSLEKKVMEEDISFRLGFGSSSKWNGELMAAAASYPGDNNRLTTLSGWILSSALTRGALQLSAGYGFSLGDALHDRFESILPLDQILGSAWSTDPIEGRYDPYFSPNNMEVHSLLAVLAYRRGERTFVNTTLNYGVYASAEHPYLYLDRKGNGSLYLAKGFAPTRFHPLEARMELLFKATPRWSIRGEVRYAKTLYYSSLATGLHLSVSL